MGRETIDKFARMYVVPQGGHGLAGRSYSKNGRGETITVKNVPGPNDKAQLDLEIVQRLNFLR